MIAFLEMEDVARLVIETSICHILWLTFLPSRSYSAQDSAVAHQYLSSGLDPVSITPKVH